MDLSPLMKPARIAVVGASQRMTRATRVVANLQRFGYAGRIFPINPRYSDVLGLPCYPDLASTPERADSVVVAIPAEQVNVVIAQLVSSSFRNLTDKTLSQHKKGYSYPYEFLVGAANPEGFSNQCDSGILLCRRPVF